MDTPPPPPSQQNSNDKDRAALRAQIANALRTDERQPEKSLKIAALVSAALKKRGRFYFHAERRDFDSAMFFDSDRRVLLRLQSDEFKAWLSEWTGINRAVPAYKHVVAALETAALSGSHTRGIIPESYWATRGDAIYLSNGDGEMARITASGVDLVNNGTDDVLFAAGKTLQCWTLVDPVDPFDSCALFREAMFSQPHGKDLTRLFLISLPTNPRSKPPLVFVGSVGSGKTQLAMGLARLYGIPIQAVKVDERKESDFWPLLNHGGITIFDNVDSRIKWFADALASAATDGCSTTRRLYSNDETVRLEARAWVTVTSSQPSFASDAGLADRVLLVRLERREGETKANALSEEIVSHRNGALSFIALSLSKALNDDADVPTQLNARHPDWAKMAVRLGRAIGRESATVTALRRAESDKSLFCLENDFIGGALLTLLQSEGSFSGSAGDLANRLSALDPVYSRLTARGVSKQLTKLWPHLAVVINASKQVGHGGALSFTFERREIQPDSGAAARGDLVTSKG